MDHGRLISRKTSLLLFTVLIFFFGLIWNYFDSSNHGKNNFQLDKTELMSGDLVFILGDGFWSQFFKNISQNEKRFSHVGIISKKEGEPHVVHASASDFTGIGRVSIVAFKDFIKECSDFSIYRVDANNSVRDKIADTVLNFVGYPFDRNFDLTSTDSVYCAELIRIAVNQSTGLEIIGTSKFAAGEFVCIDDCYLNNKIKIVFDKSPK